MRQIVETLTAVRGFRMPALHGLSDLNGSSEKSRSGDRSDSVAVNRCQRRLTGGILRRHHVETVLGNEKVFYVGEEPTALESINTGTPIGITKTGGAFVKTLRRSRLLWRIEIVAHCVGLRLHKGGTAMSFLYGTVRRPLDESQSTAVGGTDSETEALYKDLIERRPALLEEKLKLHARIIDEFNLTLWRKLPRGETGQTGSRLCGDLRAL